MTAHDSDVRALRDALLPAIVRDLAGARRRPAPRVAIPLAVCATLLAGTGVAAATGLLFSDPKPDPAVPAVEEWTYVSHDPSSPSGDGGPVLMRPKAEALARTNRATEAALLERGITARCGTDAAHPLACYLPSGDPVPPGDLNVALTSLQGAAVLESSRDNYELRPLSEAQARRWLCDHPNQRPTDGASNQDDAGC